MISVEGWTVTYDGASRPALRDADLHVDEGELVLVVGETGSGKSTLLRSLDGLVPHFSGGTVSGRVQVAGRDTRTHRPRDLADVVGMVVQYPAASFVTGLLLLAQQRWARNLHTALGVVVLAWTAWGLQDNLLWWLSSGLYIAVACLLVWTPGASRWYARRPA